MSSDTGRLGSLPGRDEELRRIRMLLGVARLVTVTGPGGIGKTTVVRHIAGEAGRADGDCWFVDLTSTTSASEIARVVATVVGLVVTERETPDAALESFLRSRASLLVLDNLEHLAGAGSLIEGWLARLPGLRVLATSRIPLGTAAEIAVPLPGLGLPERDDPESVATSPAGRLFLERAQRVGSTAPLDKDAAGDLAAVLRSLDGSPLAIELAAGRMRILSPAGLRRRLSDPGVLAAVRGNAEEPDRHGSLRDVLAMTLDLLPGDGRRLLVGLSTCPGSFDLDLAQALAPEIPAVPALDLLVSAGLVSPAEPVAGEPRFRLLETIRSQVATELDPAAAGRLHERHARAVAGMLERLNREWLIDERAATDRAMAEDDNIVAAMDWATAHDPDLALSMLAALDRYHQDGISLERSVRWCREAIARASPDHPHRPHVVGSLLRLLTRFAGPTEALRLEPEVIAAAQASPGPLRRSSYLRLAHAYYAAGDVPSTIRYNRLAADASLDPDDATALRLDAEALSAWHDTGNAITAARMHLASAAASRRAGRLTNQGIDLFKAATLELRAGATAEAIRHAREATVACPPGNVRAFAFDILAFALAEVGSVPEARTALRSAWAHVEREAVIDRIEALEAAVALLTAEHRCEEAVRAITVADRERLATGWTRDPYLAGLIERWRSSAIRDLEPIRHRLAEQAAATLSLEEAIAPALAVPPATPSGVRATVRAPQSVRAPETLTAREVEVLALLALGRSDSEIAEALFISPKTASVHVANIKGKLGLGSRLEVALHARDLGFGAQGTEHPPLH
jgi:predicted ATPase/DNA-binding CsgD family transcriptional regulator